MTERPNPRRTPRILRGVAAVAASTIAATMILGIVLWDADLYTARDRYEYLKLALFSEWQPNWCPPGRESAQCADLADFETALEDATDFTFFRSEAIMNSDLVVQTGIRFSTVRDVVDGTASSQWCYISVPQGKVSQQIELATKSADEPPIYTSLASLDAAAVAATSLSADALSGLARSHCRFD